jgi:hypothetical protein
VRVRYGHPPGLMHYICVRGTLVLLYSQVIGRSMQQTRHYPQIRMIHSSLQSAAVNSRSSPGLCAVALFLDADRQHTWLLFVSLYEELAI